MGNNNTLEYIPEVQGRIEQFLLMKRDRDGSKTPTFGQIRVVSSILSGTAKSPTEAVRLADYGAKTVDNPSRVIKSKGVAEAIDMIGVDNIELAKTNKDILKKSYKIETATFPPIPKQRKDEEDGEYEERIRDVITNDQIREIIGGNGGFVKHIGEGNAGRTVTYTFPDNQARLKALELIYKVKGSFAPIKNANKNMNTNFSPAILREEMKKRHIEITDLM